MSGQLILRRLGSIARWQQVRSCSAVAHSKQTVTMYPMEQPDAAERDKNYPSLGERDMVGHGLGNEGLYVDDYEWPCPGVRFKVNTPEILALRQKEAGDWGNLSLEDKKVLYRASFAQTFEEMLAPSGELKRQIIIFLFGCFATQLLIWAQEDLILPAPSAQLNEGQIEAVTRRVVESRRGIMYGMSSRYDYSKGEYKPGMQPKGRAEK